MRDFFITWFERLVSVIIVVLALVVLIGAFVALKTQGFLAFLGALIIGAIYVLFIGGVMYLGLGIYQNTRKSAELLEKIAAK